MESILARDHAFEVVSKSGFCLSAEFLVLKKSLATCRGWVWSWGSEVSGIDAGRESLEETMLLMGAGLIETGTMLETDDRSGM